MKQERRKCSTEENSTKSCGQKKSETRPQGEKDCGGGRSKV